MLDYLFLCCQSKDKDQPNTVTLEDVINNNNSKNAGNMNNTTSQDNNNINNKEEIIGQNKDTEFFPNGVILNDKGFFMNESNLYNKTTNPNNAPILTINNINNININLQRNSFSKEPTKLLEKKDSRSIDTPKNDINDINEIIKQQSIISGENSKDILQSKSFISFSNLTINYNNNPQGSSINFSDTEVVSLCELTLTGDLFFNKEIKIDRSGIKNTNIVNTNTNRIPKNKNKKACEIKFGLISNIAAKLSTSSLIKNNDEKITNVNVTNKNSCKNLSSYTNINNKLATLKSGQKKKLQSLSSLTSVNNNKNVVDYILNLSYTKIVRKINELTNNSIAANDNVILFILKYDTTLDMFKFTSMQDSIPMELLLNYNYPLRFQQIYNILIGGVTIKLKVIKNEKNESMINIVVINNEENKNGEEKNNNIIYNFNPFIDKMPITIGRINCNVNLNNISVSKTHAQIDYIHDYDEFFITDCKSTNGTYLLLKSPLNYIYIKREHQFKFLESKFKSPYVNFES